MAASKEPNRRAFYLCTGIYLPFSALIGAGTGLLLALLFYSAMIAADPTFTWQTWGFLYFTAAMGGLAGVLGGIIFSLLVFRRDTGWRGFFKAPLFSLGTLLVAAFMYAIMMNLYSPVFGIGYNTGLFFMYAFIPWLIVSMAVFLLRAWLR